MGRKIDMKKIEDVTKCQVTFSKRRSSLMKKANEIAICCDVDVAFVAFSPSGRVSKFCNRRRIEDLLHRYVNLPAESRVSQLDDVQRKLEKLKNLDHIKSDTSKLQYLDKQIENLELQIKKCGLELQILEANLRDYELDPEQEPSLHQLSWCERNINHSLERVLARKSALFDHLQTTNVQPSFQMDLTVLQNEDDIPFPSNFIENEPSLPISPYSGKVRFQDILNQANSSPCLDPGTSNLSNLSILQNTYDLPHSGIICNLETMIESDRENHTSFQNPQQQPIVADHTLLNFSQQDTVNGWNNSSPATFSNAFYNSTLSLSNMPHLRSTSTTTFGSNLKIPQVDTIQSSSQYASCNFTNKAEETNQVNTLDNSKQEGTSGDNTCWTSKIQKSNLWEWEDLLLDENFNLGFSK